jgi:hypothetical protein
MSFIYEYRKAISKMLNIPMEILFPPPPPIPPRKCALQWRKPKDRP